MKITSEQVKYVAKLARLELSSGEVESVTGHLDRILTYVEKLNELDTSGVKPTTHALEITNVFREDQVQQSIGQEKALANAPRQNSESFIVPRVI
jgi:aspartyl-tRNA(Asn)/glutamyl-tRNA(Gln) amidotransferase subunit C